MNYPPEVDLDAIDLPLMDALHELVRGKPPCEVSWLTARARSIRKDARIDDRVIFEAVSQSTLLVDLPDGRVQHLQELLDGCVFTQRARAATAGRRDLWADVSLQPVLNLLVDGPVPHADGGEVSCSPFGQPAIVGPGGWLPSVAPYKLVGVRVSGGALSAERVQRVVSGSAQKQRLRELIARHYRKERWWSGGDDLESRPGELVRAISYAKLEDPMLFTKPLPPLSELLYDPLEQARDDNHWRDFAACRQDQSVSFYVTGMPESLYAELGRRAKDYGMSFDQYVIAVIGHLAWRTPFAEDMTSWHEPLLRQEEAWDEQARLARVRELEEIDAYNAQRHLMPGVPGELDDR